MYGGESGMAGGQIQTPLTRDTRRAKIPTKRKDFILEKRQRRRKRQREKWSRASS